MTKLFRFFFFHWNLNDGFALIKTAERTHTVRDNRLLAIGTLSKTRGADLPMSPSFASPLLGMLSFRIWHSNGSLLISEYGLTKAGVLVYLRDHRPCASRPDFLNLWDNGRHPRSDSSRN